MDQNHMTENSSPSSSSPASAHAAQGAHSLVPILVAIAALLVAAIGVYFITSVQQEVPPTEQQEYASDPNSVPTTPPTTGETTLPDPASIPVGAEDPAMKVLSTQNTSDEVVDIERDLNATDMGILDGINNI